MSTPSSVLSIVIMALLAVSRISHAEESEPLAEDFLLFVEEWADEQGDIVMPEDAELAQGPSQSLRKAEVGDTWLEEGHD
ncbi:hypothetical protein MO867_06790 [Microbulbifer sp. OS29]|uniref:Uncharacterized protein n=1 Tax=Microbulbifer okhotskensis TaxID=2926617 RepID=A0A9X2ELU8_9GAMM|nr:hypothetical protein [Microbulbifer okhotskensis]MCO1334046.1 hypothetical protein [Microbulbifer okhotskensis]